jgi:hypothetical protein
MNGVRSGALTDRATPTVTRQPPLVASVRIRSKSMRQLGLVAHGPKVGDQ